MKAPLPQVQMTGPLIILRLRPQPGVDRIAAASNVAVKISSLAMFRHDWTAALIRPSCSMRSRTSTPRAACSPATFRSRSYRR